MDEARALLKQQLMEWLISLVPSYADVAYGALVLLWVAVVAVAIHLILHRVVLRWVGSRVSFGTRPRHHWRETLHRRKLFSRLVLILQAIIIRVQASLWLSGDSSLLAIVETAAHIWVVVFSTLSLFSVLNSLFDILQRNPSMRQFPLGGLIQSAKLVLAVLAALLVLASLMGESPLLLLSGLGAVSAVLMLVFRDPILGLAAGLQLSANRMLAVGDWLEMPQYGADGDVIDIGLTTVKVRNWDRTITSIPTYALISDSFKNWRGMSESGGRRIKRSLLVDTSSIRFLDEEDIERLRRIQLLTSYLKDRTEEIGRYNSDKKADLSSMVNGRRLTNLGTFRAYLTVYLKTHPKIHQHMTLMVRQNDPGAAGLPIEIYAFTNTTDWLEYEGIQGDIFDHIFAVLLEFGLRAHEAPTGYDLRALKTDSDSRSIQASDSQSESRLHSPG